jgi:hypothetical protein
MNKTRSVLGLIGGAILILSSGAHSILGWKAMGEQLATTNAPVELVTGLKFGWMFGAPVMLVLGILAVVTFLKRYRGEPASTLAPALTAAAYLGFAAWAAVETNFDPFFFMFLIPGVLLALASTR